MSYSYALALFALGTIIGSFLNALSFRINTGLSMFSRSQCFSCTKTLSWYELIPILSFFALRGKCSSCKSSISIQYPLVELLTGIVFAFLGIRFLSDFSYDSFFLFSFFAFEASVLIAIAIYDIHHKIIPDSLVWLFNVVAIFSASLIGEDFYNHLLSGFILAIPLASLWYFSSGRWMGLGDAKLALGIGFLLGLNSGVLAIVFAFWSGALVGVVLLALSYLGKRLSLGGETITMKSELPFAPFIVLGALVVVLLDLDLSLLIFSFS